MSVKYGCTLQSVACRTNHSTSSGEVEDREPANKNNLESVHHPFIIHLLEDLLGCYQYSFANRYLRSLDEIDCLTH